MNRSVFRPFQLVVFGLLALVVVALVISATLTAFEQRRLAAAADRLGRVHHFERIQVVVWQQVGTLIDDRPDNDPAAEDLARQIEELKQYCLSEKTPPLLDRFRHRVLQKVNTGHPLSPATVLLFQRITVLEGASKADLLASLQDQAVLQRNLELAAPLAIIAAAILLVPIMRRRIIGPLDAFGRQLGRLADGDFKPAPVDHIDPFLLPLHRQLNALIDRLTALEAAHEARAASLEAEVRAATRTLLEQQRSLARAERLAATGELAASVAHELRNPLAGIQMTLANLRAELSDPDLAARLDLVLNEVTRLNRLLTQLLDTARHEPELARPLAIATLLDELVALMRCQIPPAVRLESRVPRDLTCRLPPDRLRQALLNLVLNASAALGAAGGTITVDAQASDGRIRITVSDDGPGFPDDVLRTGIRPFLSTRARGTGLGLAVVRRFARDLGGDLQLDNRQPHGAIVTIDLPLEEEAR
jgi:two-component system NtrC family sensor kinase